jgi:hypothetical protein
MKIVGHPTLLMLLLEPLNYALELGIAGAKAARQPIAATLGNLLAVSNHVELTGPARRKHGVYVEALLNEGHETRDLRAVVLSGRTVDDLDFHSVPPGS